MTKLKPQLIIAGPNKKKGGFARGMGYFLVLAIVFVLGVYVGMGVNNSQFGSEQFIGMSQGENSSNSNQVERGITQDTQQKVDTNNDVLAESDTVKDIDNRVEALDDTNSGLSLDEIEASDNTTVVSSLSGSTASRSSTVGLDSDSASDDLIDRDTYRLQVAAFGSFDQASEAVNDLVLRGYDAYIVTTANSRGEVWNLIKVGKFNTALEAWNYSTIFRSQEGGEVIVESISKGRVYDVSMEENNDTL